MYIEAVPNRASPPAILLRESYRDAGRIKKRTLANLSDWPTELIEGLRTLLMGGAGERCRELVIAMLVNRIVAPASKAATARMLDVETAASSLGAVLKLGAVDED